MAATNTPPATIEKQAVDSVSKAKWEVLLRILPEMSN